MDLKFLLLVVLTYVGYNAVSGSQSGNINELRFLCKGYNILKGNPDGATAQNSQITDPGIIDTRRVCQVSYTDQSAVKVPRDNCKTRETMYKDTKSYHEKLMNEINVAASGSYMGFSFAASAGYKASKEQTIDSMSLIFEKSKVCYTASLRYRSELARAYKFTVSDSFASEVCHLPSVYNSQTKKIFMDFFEKLGTHVITELNLGTKNIERKKTTTQSVLDYAETSYSSSVSVSGGVGGFSGSLSVDVSGYEHTKSFKDLFKSSVTTYAIGTRALPEPIRLTLKENTEFLQSKYWSHLTALKTKGICNSRFSLSRAYRNIRAAMNDYPQWLKVEKPKANAIRIPLAWPRGTYGLLSPTISCSRRDTRKHQSSACPENSWVTGWRYHDSEDSNNANKWYTTGNCARVDINRRGIRYHFCMQHKASGPYRRNWPKGSYCLFRKGSCPSGFHASSMRYDDEDKRNGNRYYGHLPDGRYDKNTVYQYCCRKDAYPTQQMFLPTGKPFVLLAVTRFCQKVAGMRVYRNEFNSDDEDSRNGNKFQGLHPYNYNWRRNHRLIFCYYRKI